MDISEELTTTAEEDGEQSDQEDSTYEPPLATGSTSKVVKCTTPVSILSPASLESWAKRQKEQKTRYRQPGRSGPVILKIRKPDCSLGYSGNNVTDSPSITQENDSSKESSMDSSTDSTPIKNLAEANLVSAKAEIEAEASSSGEKGNKSPMPSLDLMEHVCEACTVSFPNKASYLTHRKRFHGGGTNTQSTQPNSNKGKSTNHAPTAGLMGDAGEISQMSNNKRTFHKVLRKSGQTVSETETASNSILDHGVYLYDPETCTTRIDVSADLEKPMMQGETGESPSKIRTVVFNNVQSFEKWRARLEKTNRANSFLAGKKKTQKKASPEKKVAVPVPMLTPDETVRPSADGCMPYTMKAMTSNEAAELLLSKSDEAGCCNKVPLYGAGDPWKPDTCTFVIDLSRLDSVQEYGDLSTDGYAPWGSKGVQIGWKYFQLKEDGSFKLVPLGRLKKPDDCWNIKLKCNVYTHQQGSFGKKIFCLMKQDRSLVKSYAAISYYWTDHVKEIVPGSHGNSRRKDLSTPYQRTRPSTIRRIQQETNSKPPRGVMASLAGEGISNFWNSPAEQPRDRKQIYNQSKKSQFDYRRTINAGAGPRPAKSKATPPGKWAKKRKPDGGKVEEKMLEMLANYDRKQEDELALFGTCMANRMRPFPDRMRRQCMHEFEEVLYKFESALFENEYEGHILIE